MILLLAAEAPLVFYTVVTALQNDRLRAQDAVSRTASAQAAALRDLASGLRVAASIAGTAVALPGALLENRLQCDKVLASLIAGSDDRVASISIADRAGMVQCTAGAAVEPRLNPPDPVTQIVSGLWIESSGGALSVVKPMLSGPDRFVHARLAPPRPDPGFAAVTPPALWLDTEGLLLAASAQAVVDAQPQAVRQLPSTESPAVRLTARTGHSTLYSAAALPPGMGRPDDLLMAGSDIRRAAAATSRSFLERVAELTAFFLGEFLLIAAGVSMVASEPLRRLNLAVDRWRAEGRFIGLGPAQAPLEVGELSQSFAQATVSLNERESELRAAIARQELAMQEIHHRVKNNLQIIASLLNLQSARIKAPEARAEFQSARSRVRALAILHRHLYADGNLHLIDLRAFFAELCTHLFQSMNEVEGERITLGITAPSVDMSSDQAVPIALIVTEVVGNALQYAFPDERSGRLEVSYDLGEGGQATLTICDNGVGLPSGDAPNDRGGGLGLQLVRGFARQLGGTLTISTEAGTSYTLVMAIEPQRLQAVAFGVAAKA